MTLWHCLYEMRTKDLSWLCVTIQWFSPMAPIWCRHHTLELPAFQPPANQISSPYKLPIQWHFYCQARKGNKFSLFCFLGFYLSTICPHTQVLVILNLLVASRTLEGTLYNAQATGIQDQPKLQPFQL